MEIGEKLAALISERPIFDAVGKVMTRLLALAEGEAKKGASLNIGVGIGIAKAMEAINEEVAKAVVEQNELRKDLTDSIEAMMIERASQDEQPVIEVRPFWTGDEPRETETLPPVAHELKDHTPVAIGMHPSPFSRQRKGKRTFH